MTIRDWDLQTAKSTFTQLLSSEPFVPMFLLQTLSSGGGNTSGLVMQNCVFPAVRSSCKHVVLYGPVLTPMYHTQWHQSRLFLRGVMRYRLVCALVLSVLEATESADHGG